MEYIANFIGNRYDTFLQQEALRKRKLEHLTKETIQQKKNTMEHEASRKKIMDDIGFKLGKSGETIHAKTQTIKRGEKPDDYLEGRKTKYRDDLYNHLKHPKDFIKPERLDTVEEYEKFLANEKKEPEMAHLLAGAALAAGANFALGASLPHEQKISKQIHDEQLHNNTTLATAAPNASSSALNNFLFSTRNLGKGALPKALKILARTNDNAKIIEVLSDASAIFKENGNKKVVQILDNILSTPNVKNHIENITSTIKLGDRNTLMQSTRDLDMFDLKSIGTSGFTRTRGIKRPGTLYGQHPEEGGYDMDDQNDIIAQKVKESAKLEEEKIARKQFAKDMASGRIDETQNIVPTESSGPQDTGPASANPSDPTLQKTEEEYPDDSNVAPTGPPIFQRFKNAMSGAPTPGVSQINSAQVSQPSLSFNPSKDIYFRPNKNYNGVDVFGSKPFYKSEKTNAGDFYSRFPQYKDKLLQNDQDIYYRKPGNPYKDELHHKTSENIIDAEKKKLVFPKYDMSGIISGFEDRPIPLITQDVGGRLSELLVNAYMTQGASLPFDLYQTAVNADRDIATAFGGTSIHEGITKAQEELGIKQGLFRPRQSNIISGLALGADYSIGGLPLEQAQQIFPEEDFSQFKAPVYENPSGNIREVGHPVELPNMPNVNPLEELVVDPSRAPPLDAWAVGAQAVKDLVGQAGTVGAAAFIQQQTGGLGGLLFGSALSGLINQVNRLDPGRGYQQNVGSQLFYELEKGILQGVKAINPEWIAPQILNPLLSQSDNARTSLTVQDIFSKGVTERSGITLAQNGFNNWYRDSVTPYAINLQSGKQVLLPNKKRSRGRS